MKTMLCNDRVLFKTFSYHTGKVVISTVVWLLKSWSGETMLYNDKVLVKTFPCHTDK